MYIGLVRHFKVNCDKKLLMTSDDFSQWAKQYDTSDIIVGKFEMGNTVWNKCFSSDLSRAVKTSASIFSGEVRQTKMLREVPMAPVFKTNLKLPYMFWCACARAAWFLRNKSQMETIKETEKRVSVFMDKIESDHDKNILVVCHGFLIQTLQKELKKRGFNGKKTIRPKNGRLYLYKR